MFLILADRLARRIVTHDARNDGNAGITKLLEFGYVIWPDATGKENRSAIDGFRPAYRCGGNDLTTTSGAGRKHRTERDVVGPVVARPAYGVHVVGASDTTPEGSTDGGLDNPAIGWNRIEGHASQRGVCQVRPLVVDEYGYILGMAALAQLVNQFGDIIAAAEMVPNLQGGDTFGQCRIQPVI